MALTISTAARNAAAEAVAGLVDAGTGAGALLIYDGTRPAGPDTAVTNQTLLAEIELNDPAFGPASNGTVLLDVDGLTTTGLAAGTATWFRFTDSDGNGVIDGSVTATGGGGDLTLNTTTISIGLTVEITSGQITMPAGSA